jgi:peptide/nickel transport system permease protein
VQLDFGKSLLAREGAPTIVDELGTKLPVTFSIAFAGLFFSVLFGVPLGLLSALRPGGWIDRASVTLTSLGLAIPSFVAALFLINTFAIDRDWFPALQYTNFGDNPWEWLRSITLPAVSIGLFAAASVARQVRAATIDALQSNYVRTALSVGTGTRRTVLKYAFKNASIPAVTVLGLQLTTLLGGVVIIERIFVIPGIGSYMFRALSAPDVPVIQAVTLTFVIIHVLVNLAIDISYGFLNPRVRVS